MNRRKAVTTLLLAGAAGTAAWSGFKIFGRYRTPHLGLLDEHRELITELADIIIPRTDTPGARDAGVGDFIRIMIRDCTPRTAQNRFLEGLEDVAAYTHSRYQRPLTQCSPAEKHQVVAHFADRDQPWAGTAGKISRKLLGDAFFTTLKKYTIMGYCTSAIGATQGMAYDYVPGGYKGCVPLQPGQKCWAT